MAFTIENGLLKEYRLESGETEVVIPNGVTEIGGKVFSNYSYKGLAKVTIPNGVTIIGEEAFEGCRDLIQVIIADSVEKIGKRAFNGCNPSLELRLPARFDSIVPQKFLIEAEVLKDYLGWGNETEIVIPDGISKIGENAFKNYRSIETVKLPNTLKIIGKAAFRGCYQLVRILLPNGLVDIGPEAFSFCVSLQQIKIPDSVTSIGDQAFSFCEKLMQIKLSESVTHIGEEAFLHCNSLSEVIIPPSLRDAEFIIENGKLMRNLNWGIEKKIEIPKGVRIIGPRAFNHCENLTNIIIPDGMSEICSNAFFYCEALTGIQLPASIKTIGNNAFAGIGSKFRDKGGLFEAIIPEELKPLLNGTGLTGDKGIHKKYISGVPKQKPKPIKRIRTYVELRADADTIAAWVENQSYFALMQKKFPADKMPKIKLINGKPAPVEALQFIAFSYCKSVKDLPGQNKSNYRTAIGEALFMPDADKVADLLDRDSLCEALSELAFEETYYRDYQYGQEFKVPVKKKATGIEKGFSFTDWLYETSHKHSIEMATDPYWEIAVQAFCRYGDEAMIDQVCKWINHFLEYRLFDQRGRKFAVLGRTALLLSDTRRAAMYLDKCGALRAYAQMRKKTEAEIRDGFASALGFDADGTLSLDAEE